MYEGSISLPHRAGPLSRTLPPNLTSDNRRADLGQPDEPSRNLQLLRPIEKMQHRPQVNNIHLAMQSIEPRARINDIGFYELSLHRIPITEEVIANLPKLPHDVRRIHLVSRRTVNCQSSQVLPHAATYVEKCVATLKPFHNRFIRIRMKNAGRQKAPLSDTRVRTSLPCAIALSSSFQHVAGEKNGRAATK